MIIFENVTLGYHRAPVLSAINWIIQPNEHWVIGGLSGSGKSLLLQALAKDTHILEGKIHRPDLGKNPGYEKLKNNFQLVEFRNEKGITPGQGIVFYYQQRYQAFDSYGHLTVREFLNLTAKQADLLIEIPVWTDILPLLERELIKLSSGQMRKILLIRAWLNHTPYVLLDHPHAGLDAASVESFNRYIDRIVSDRNQQFILAGHFRSLPQVMTHFAYLDSGKFTVRNKNGVIKTKAKKVYTKSEIPKLLRDSFPAPVQFSNGEVLNFNQLRITYDQKNLFEGFSWKVSQGEKWLLTGPNGSGKSTLLSLIYADHPQAYANDIRLFGKNRGSGESIWEIKRFTGYTSSELHQYFREPFTAKQLILSGLKDNFNTVKSDLIKENVVLQLLHFFGMDHLADKSYLTLPTGQQRLLFFLRSLIKNPSLLLLDEPYQGMDSRLITQCDQLLNSILTPAHTVIFISHLENEIPAWINRHRTLPETKK